MVVRRELPLRSPTSVTNPCRAPMSRGVASRYCSRRLPPALSLPFATFLPALVFFAGFVGAAAGAGADCDRNKALIAAAAPPGLPGAVTDTAVRAGAGAGAFGAIADGFWRGPGFATTGAGVATGFANGLVGAVRTAGFTAGLAADLRMGMAGATDSGFGAAAAFLRRAAGATAKAAGPPDGAV